MGESSERTILNQSAFPVRFALDGGAVSETDFPDALLGPYLSRDELSSVVAGARAVYAQSRVACLYYILVPSFLLCLCLCDALLICAVEKRRDRRVRAFLERCNSATFEARGVRFGLEVRDGVWIVVDRVEPEEDNL